VDFNAGINRITGHPWNHQFQIRVCLFKSLKSKDIPVTGREGPFSCERLRFPHFLDNRLTDGGKFVSLTRRPPFTPQTNS
jgi:hypothetical protein